MTRRPPKPKIVGSSPVKRVRFLVLFSKLLKKMYLLTIFKNFIGQWRGNVQKHSVLNGTRISQHYELKKHSTDLELR